MLMQPPHVLAHRAFALPSLMPAQLTCGFEQKLAHGVLRRLECKELLFAEGDPASHVYRIETLSTRC